LGFIGGDQEHLADAAAAMKPVADSVGSQARAVMSAGDQAAAAAHNAVAASAISQLTSVLAKAAGDTGVIIDRLGNVAEITSSNLRKAGGT
jgi:hypothetical protein